MSDIRRRRGGLGLLVGLVAASAGLAVSIPVSAVASTATPSTVPTNVTVQGTTDVLMLGADSTAAMVQFQIDPGTGSLVTLPPVTVSGGTASVGWPSWGFPNGSDAVTAADCSDAVTCGSSSAPTSFTLANAAPVLTTPASGAAVRGGFTLTATSSGGAVRFLIDGIGVGFDTSSPYSFDYRGAALTQGTHQITTQQCSVDTTHCAGPASAPVAITADVLHPSLTSVLPNPFSPNGDRVKDTTVATIGLSEPQTVHVSVVNAAAVTVRSANLGALGAGSHAWTWDGRRSDLTRAPDGSYTIRVSTSMVINGVTVPGTASRTVRVDTIAPTLSSITGNGATFYPYPDNYGDTYSPGLTLNEPALLRLVITNSAGTTVRVLQATKPAGRAWLTWNGRDTANHLVAAGIYHWTYTATDAAGNHRASPRDSVVVSAKRLVAKSVTITKNGGAYYDLRTNTSSTCAGYGGSAFTHGVWLDNTCNPATTGPVIVAARYAFSVPAATRYGSLTAQTYGGPDSGTTPAEIFTAYQDTSGNADLRFIKVTSSAHAWYTFAATTEAGRVTSARQTVVAIGVDNTYNNATHPDSNFDIGYIRLTIRYYVLQ